MPNPDLFVRASFPAGWFSVPRVVAERGKWRVLKQPATDSQGRPLPPKPREDKLAATPNPDPETASGDTTEESE